MITVCVQQCDAWFGVGKSTLLKCISYVYNAADVGTMSNKMEAQFGLSAFFDKLLVIAPEVGDFSAFSLFVCAGVTLND